MKISDNYGAKYEIWARAGKVYRLPVPKGLPPFKSRRFDSYDEFNAWKRDRLRQIAEQGGVTWTK